MKLLNQVPSKDEWESSYLCGFIAVGTWASRIEKHREFISTTMGKYILELESKCLKTKES